MVTPHQPDQTPDEQTNPPGTRGITAGQNVQHSILVTGDNNQVIFESVATQRVTQSARYATGGLSPVSLQEYHVFLASPGDVNEERTAVRRFFDQYNRTVARPNFGVQFTVIDWENYATAGVGRPQELITAQTLEKYRGSLALVIGLMGQRFGTPTGDHESGTEEEFRWAMQNYLAHGFPEIKWFFRRIDGFSTPSTDLEEIMAAVEQWKKVQTFKASLREQTKQQSDFPPLYYKEFTDLQNFRDILQDDLLLWLNAAERPWVQSAPVLESTTIASTTQPPAAYYQAVVNDFQWLDIAGIDNDRSFRIPLSEMYVRLRVMMDEDTSDAESDYDGRPIDIQTALARYQNLVIVGDPGSGKSTFLRFIALMIARAVREHDLDLAQERLNLTAPLPIPIFISLWDLADFARQQTQSAVKLPVLLEFMRDRLAGMGCKLTEEQLKTWLNDGLCILLFDGLDEVPTDSGRALVSRLVESCVAQYPTNRYVITSRIRAYTGNTILYGNFVRCDIQPFNQTDRTEFLRNWTALLFKTAPADVDLAGSDSAREFGNLTDAVEHNERIRTLAVNPLLLTVVAIVHWNRKRLPEQRVELYDECIDVLLGQRKEAERTQISPNVTALDEAQEDAKQFDRSWVRKRFGEIALQITLSGDEEEISKHRVIELLAQRFWDRGAKTQEQAEYEAERFLEQHELRSGLLISRRASSYRFVHLTFQEYLAAWSLATQATDKVFEEIEPQLREQKWFEALVLLGGEWARRSDDILNQYITFLLEKQGKSIEERVPVVALCANIMNDISSIAQVEPATRVAYEEALQDTLNAFEPISGIASKNQLEILNALAYLGSSVKPHLINATYSRNGTVRSRAVELLIPHLPEDDLFSMAHLLKDRSNTTIRTYLTSLVECDLERTITLLEKENGPTSKLGHALHHMIHTLLTGQDEWDNRLWKVIIKCAEHDLDPNSRKLALELLPRHQGIMTSALEPVKRLAEHDANSDVRLRALELLAEHRGAEEFTWELVARLAENDPDAYVRLHALKLLDCHRGTYISTLKLVARLAENDSYHDVRWRALAILAEHRETDETTVELIARLAKNAAYGDIRRRARQLLKETYKR
ncbi:MAG: NACHT domain-containing protein [Caldilineaceae bacterium]